MDTQPQMITSEATTSPTPTVILIHSPVDGSNGDWHVPAADAYIFPIDPRRTPKEWEAAGANRSSLLQIPDNLLKQMTTYGLIETIINYPYSNDFINHAPYLMVGLEGRLNKFNGYIELLSREDSARELIRLYSSINIQSMKDNAWVYSLTFIMIELLISNYEILNKMTFLEKSIMISLVIENTKHAEAAYIMPLGTLILLGRLLEQVSPSFQTYLQTDPAIYEIIHDGLALTSDAKTTYRLIDSVFITCAQTDNIVEK